jgi:hypothetical protein
MAWSIRKRERTMSYRQLNARLAKLEVQLPKPSIVQDRPARKQRARLARRLVRLFEPAGRLMTEEESEKLDQALRQWIEGRHGPYAMWFEEILCGRGRLPALDAAAMKGLLLAWLSPARDQFACVCRQCGLLYPHHRWPPYNEWKLLPGKVPRVGSPPWYDLPEFFASCPGCGASTNDFDWSHLVDGVYRPWMALDGYMGRS